MELVTLSLVSHTNVGKTTLARTLLRRDVGEVLDHAHVTEVPEDYVLIETEKSRLVLWDTPGFGDSVRLLKRLRRHDLPILWFLQQAWDRVTDRPLWCSQQAALNIRQEADAVLYLVNAAEEPEAAGYVIPELELLSWIGRPIVLLLNQTGDATPAAMNRSVEAWRRHAERFDSVHEVLPLDAFSRAWVQEGLLFERLTEHLPQARREAMEELVEAWNRRNLRVFERAMEVLASYLAAAAADREELSAKRPSRDQKRRAMEALGRRLEEASEELMADLLRLHGLEGGAMVEIERQLDAFAVEGEELLDPEKGALMGGLVSGALGGLTADIMAGGLTFGGGILAGAILGALGGAGLARGYQLVKGERLPEVGWAAPFLDRLAAQTLLRYFAVAHFGRGRGEFREHRVSERWTRRVEAALNGRHAGWGEAWKEAAGEGGRSREASALHRLIRETARAVLIEEYPEAEGMIRPSVRADSG